MIFFSGKSISSLTPIGSDASWSHVQLPFPIRVISDNLIKRQEHLLLEKAYSKKEKRRELTSQLFRVLYYFAILLLKKKLTFVH